ncbi:MAG: Gfo/Idh/MocA family oxidoreductase [Ruminococcaceae bacterium]|nr:Gfo/Idh/MocA family oxidoreductase [Oscillospiraceae bacterium]
MNIGIVGCGNISGIYFKNLTEIFQNVTIYACADLDEEKVKKAAEEWKVPHIMTLEEMLSCDEIELILNLTTPQGHYPINKKCLEAGKHVYVEKPLALTYEQGKELVELAQSKNLYIGCAPDTFMGAGIQTARKLIEDGFIGTPVAASAFMMLHGHEHWHPDPEFYYLEGGGPLFDMGPYYLTALVNLLGPATDVCAMAKKSFSTRTITSQPKYGKVIPVETETHIAGLIQFETGAVATLVTSFDVWKHSMPCIEIYGTLGSIKVPDPNTFGGSVMLSTKEDKEFREIPYISGYNENSRGMGVSNMIAAIESKAPCGASGKQGLHVLEMMEGMLKSGREQKWVSLESSTTPCYQPDREAPKGVLTV